MLLTANKEKLLLVSERATWSSRRGIIAIGSGGSYAYAAAMAFMESSPYWRGRSRSDPSASPRGSASTPTIRSRSRRYDETRVGYHDPQGDREELDKYIIGQERPSAPSRSRCATGSAGVCFRPSFAKRSPEEHHHDRTHRVGKTEIARRLAKLSNAPFIKVEATKYTEVGYVGRDVESMIRDLVGTSFSMVKSEMQKDVEEEARRRVEEAILDLLLPGTGTKTAEKGEPELPLLPDAPSAQGSDTREKFRRMLRDGLLEEKIVEVNVTRNSLPSVEIFSGTSFEEMDINFGGLGSIFGGKGRRTGLDQAGARTPLHRGG
jgi:hypothetical protein